MENTEIIEKVAHLEEREKSNTKRIDEHDSKFKEQDKEIAELKNTYAIMEKMDYRIENVESNVNEMKTDIKEIKDKPAKNYDAIKICIITSIISLIIGTGGGAIIALIIK